MREVDIRTGTASKAVDHLESAGWVRRAPNPDDRRSSLLTLADSGAALLDAATRTLEGAVHALTDDALSAGELHVLVSALTKPRAALFKAKA